MTMITADRETDAHYQGLRRHFANDDPRANGYVSVGFFRREQRLVWHMLSKHFQHEGPVIDIASGSGLMLADWPPVRARKVFALGLDFNIEACLAAGHNKFNVVRGDAFQLPFADNSMSAAICCQFLNQQKHDAFEPFVMEAARVLRPGGHLILLWRGTSFIHRLAEWAGHAVSTQCAKAKFPQFDHCMHAVETAVSRHKFSIRERGVTLPFGCRGLVRPEGIVAGLFGASNCLVLMNRKEI